MPYAEASPIYENTIQNVHLLKNNFTVQWKRESLLTLSHDTLIVTLYITSWGLLVENRMDFVETKETTSVPAKVQLGLRLRSTDQPEIAVLVLWQLVVERV